jgi:hypothetical protein
MMYGKPTAAAVTAVLRLKNCRRDNPACRFVIVGTSQYLAFAILC